MVPLYWKKPGDKPPTPQVCETQATIPAPLWEAQPDKSVVESAYPAEAAAEAENGRADLICEVTGDGTLTNCGVTQEYPTGYGFGQAALSLAKFYKMRLLTDDGRSVAGGTVHLPMLWVLSPGTSTSKKIGLEPPPR
jgi:protein TonB